MGRGLPRHRRGRARPLTRSAGAGWQGGPVRVGLTGGIASGKSTVAAVLVDLGAVLIDGDALAREVVARGTPGLAQVVAEFGDGVVEVL